MNTKNKFPKRIDRTVGNYEPTTTDSQLNLGFDIESRVFSALSNREFLNRRYSYGYRFSIIYEVRDPLNMIVPETLYVITEGAGFWPVIFIELTKHFFQYLSFGISIESLRDFLSYQYDGFEDKEGFIIMIEHYLQRLPEIYRPSGERLDIVRHWLNIKNALLHPVSLSTLPWQGKSPKREIELVYGLLKREEFIFCELNEFYAALGYGKYSSQPQIKWYRNNRVLGYLLHKLMENGFLAKNLPYDAIITSTGLFLNSRSTKFKKKNIPTIITQIKETPPKGSKLIDDLIDCLLRLKTE